MRLVPESLSAVCARFVGPHGPLFRIVWSEDRMEYRFGEQKRRYGDGRNRWILERWLRPEEYTELSPEQWAMEMEEALGPYPRNGEWEQCFVFEARIDPEGDGKVEMQGFEPPADLLEKIIQAIEAGKLRYTPNERKQAIVEKLDAMRKDNSRRFDALWNDSKPAIHAEMPEHIELIDSFPQKHRISTLDLPKYLPRKHGFKQLRGE